MQSMEFNLYLSRNEQSWILQKVDDVDHLVSKIKSRVDTNL